MGAWNQEEKERLLMLASQMKPYGAESWEVGAHVFLFLRRERLYTRKAMQRQTSSDVLGQDAGRAQGNLSRYPIRGAPTMCLFDTVPIVRNECNK